MFRVKLLALLTLTLFGVVGLFYFQVDQELASYYVEQSEQNIRKNFQQSQYFIEAEIHRRQSELISLTQSEANARRFSVEQTRVATSPSLKNSDLLGIIFFKKKQGGSGQMQWIALAPETVNDWSEYFIKKIQQSVEFEKVKGTQMYWQKQLSAQKQTIWMATQKVHLEDLLNEASEDQGEGFAVGLYASDFFSQASLRIKGFAGEFILLSDDRSALGHSVAGYVSASFDKHPFFEQKENSDRESKLVEEANFNESGHSKLGLFTRLADTNLNLLFIGTLQKIDLKKIIFTNKWGVWLVSAWLLVLAIGFLLQNSHIEKLLVMRRILINFQNGVFDIAPNWKRALGDFVPILNNLAQKISYAGEPTKLVVPSEGVVLSDKVTHPATQSASRPLKPKTIEVKSESKELVDEHLPNIEPPEILDEVELTGSGITHTDIKASLLDQANLPMGDAEGLPPQIKDSANQLEKLMQETLDKSKSIRQELAREAQDESFDEKTHNGPLEDGNVTLYTALKSSIATFEDVIDMLGVSVSITNDLDSSYALNSKVNEVVGPIKSVLQNSLDAMKEKDTKRLSISLGEDARGVYITVKDSGCGISSQNLKNIFDPFFTTKNDVEKPGLGLTSVEKTLRSMGGSVEVSSVENNWTSVTLRFSDLDVDVLGLESLSNDEIAFTEEAFVSTPIDKLGGLPPVDDSKTPTPMTPSEISKIRKISDIKIKPPLPLNENQEDSELDLEGELDDDWQGDFGTFSETRVSTHEILADSEIDEVESNGVSIEEELEQQKELEEESIEDPEENLIDDEFDSMNVVIRSPKVR